MSDELGDEQGVRARAYRFALLVIRVARKLPRDVAGRTIGGQLVRAGTGVGSNIEEAQGALTRKDFTHGMNVAKKEARESAYWFRLIRDSGLLDDPEVTTGCTEASELTRILSSIVKTTQERQARLPVSGVLSGPRSGARNS